MKKRTIPELFEASVSLYAEETYIHRYNGKEYVNCTYEYIHEQVLACVGAYLSQGIVYGDKMAIIGRGCYEWVIAELAMYYLGVINVPLSVKLEEDADLIFRLNHAEVSSVVLAPSQLERFRKFKSALIFLKRIFVLGDVEELMEGEYAFSSLLEQGQAYYKKEGVRVSDLLEKVGENDIANICYTSGTTADPKGILLTHRNYTANVEQALSIVSITPAYKTLLILPVDHSFAHTVGLYIMMAEGASIAFVHEGKTAAETLRNIPLCIQEVQPTYLLSVPALAKRFSKKITDGVFERGGLAVKLFRLGMWAGKRYVGHGGNQGKGLRCLYYPLFKLTDLLLFRKIRKKFCKSLKFFIGGGALLDEELQYFFYVLGIPMYQGYGLTEAAPVISSNGPNDYKFGSSGKVAQGIELKIVNEKDEEQAVGQKGEIIIKGENVMKGYWKNEHATQESLRGGYLYTGDIGYLDHEGYLYVLGRMKSLLIANDGEKYSPEGIEELMIEQVPFVEQIMLYNNQNPYTLGLVALNQYYLEQWASQASLDFMEDASLDRLLQMIDDAIIAWKKRVVSNHLFPERWLPSVIVISPFAFSESEGLINSTMKLVRPKVIEKSRKLIDQIYTAKGRQEVRRINRASLAQFLSSQKE